MTPILIGFILALPVIIPVSLIADIARRRRLRSAARSFKCVSCGHILGESALRLADIEWGKQLATIKTQHPHTRIRAVRDLFAICTQCGTRYSYSPKSRTFCVLDAKRN